MANPNANNNPLSNLPDPSELPFVFEWYRNRVEESFEELHKADRSDRALLIQTIHQMNDSERFWGLYAKYLNCIETAEDQSESAKHKALMCFAARIFIAGSYHIPIITP